MEDLPTVFNVLKNLKDDYRSIVKYCNTSKKIKNICIQYGPDIFGKSYSDIIYLLAINKTFPTLHHGILVERLLEYYKTYPAIWEQLNMIPRIGEIPMCGGTDFTIRDDEDDIIDRSDPKNLRYIAPYHKAILYPHKRIVFTFFRRLDKLPTNTFILQDEEILTPWNFIRMGEIEDIEDIMVNSSNFIHTNLHIWKKYIKDPFWKTKENAQYYPDLSLEKEIRKVEENTPCDGYAAYGFKVTGRSALIRKYFNIADPIVEIQFNT